MPKKKRILVAPLDWGLGHAARCVPVIQELIKSDAEVIIAAHRLPLEFLKREFPTVETIPCPGYEVQYPSANGNMALTMASQIPKILNKIRTENRWLQKTIEEKKINGVISDQRFGLYTQKIPCCFITHQLMIKSPFFEHLLHRINLSFVEKFSVCWIPDFEGDENLSGDLSHKYPLPKNSEYIGPLSRFSVTEDRTDPVVYPLMAVCSGPEPQRTVFEKIIFSQIKKNRIKAVVVRGMAGTDEHYADGNTEIHSHLDSKELESKILSSALILARPGYSTIMDLAALGKKAILIPTPGQTEQEYLAEFHHAKNHFFFMPQNEFDLQSALLSSQPFKGIGKMKPSVSLQNSVRKFTDYC